VRGATAALGLFILVGPSVPGLEAGDVISERQALMRRLADQLQGVWDGLAAGDGVAIQKGAQAIAGQAARLPALFPPESLHPPSRAQPTIAAEVSTFEAITRAMREAAEATAAAAKRETLDQVRPHLTRLVQTCRRCHRSYVRFP
jgi:cytochrome c556